MYVCVHMCVGLVELLNCSADLTALLKRCHKDEAKVSYESQGCCP